MADDYDVGYKKPPKHSQFVPGQSGNRGRGKSKELQSEMIARVQDEVVEVNAIKMKKLELAFCQAINQAIKSGKLSDLKTLCELSNKYAPIPLVDEGEKAREGAEKIFDKIINLFNNQHDIDPEDLKLVANFVSEEVRLS